MAECLIGFGAVAAAEGRVTRAARLFGAGEAALDALGTQLWPSNLSDYARWFAVARSGRAVTAFDRARAEDRALALEEAVVFTLTGDAAGTSGPSAIATASPLTPREREIARLAAQGPSNRQIAASLVIAEKTVANHLQRALEKLDLHSRTQLAARAAEFGLDPAGGSAAAT